MLAIDRMRAIAEIVRVKSSVRAVELARQFQVSGETIRRDLELLEREGLVRRVYGGAVDVHQASVSHYRERVVHRIDEKEAIGRLASTFVEDGDTLLLDVGTTINLFSQFLLEKRNLTVITPSLQVATKLRAGNVGRVLVTGGELQADEAYLTGMLAESAVQKYYVDRAFISVGGISPEVGLTDFDEHEVRLRQVMMQRAKQVIVLADSSKLGVRAFTVIGMLDEMDILVTDDEITPEMRRHIEEQGVEIRIAERSSRDRMR
ncbi:hypothetical protein ATW55_02035 [Ferroacidibacillus organovorans]|uniref:HTH deoR-type domain-containing protein n=1 Tax=Ferroacidibacillus organovorans TaxID=1765683 RepID=A0A124IVL9_9BACL|nr:hypothetical protein ATW55_02035 [Ferroacidibacillus organovorans]